MSFDRNLFSATLQSHLLRYNLSVREAARESGVSASTISRLVNGELPDIDTFAALANWLEVDTNMFFDSSPSEHDYNEAWTGLSLSLLELHVPEELIKAIITIVRLVRKEQ